MSNFIGENTFSDSKSPQVSIGMPVYNGAKFICEALDSLLTQTFTDFELIISDNASTDDTEAICRAYESKDNRIRYVRQESNKGSSANFKFVFEKSIAKYFMWAAADDVWSNNWISELIQEMTPECIAVRGGITYFNKEGEYRLYPTSFSNRQFIKCFIEDDLLARCHHIYGLFDRGKLLKSNLDILDAEYAGDIIFTCHILAFGDLKTINSTQHYYRHHDENIGSAQVRQISGWKRIVYRVHPLNYYISHIKSVPFPYNVYLAFLAPVKHIKSQFELWYRGLYKYILGRNIQEKSRQVNDHYNKIV